MTVRSCLCGWLTTGERVHHDLCAVHDQRAQQLLTIDCKLGTVIDGQKVILEKLEKIMSEDAAVLAVVTDEQAQITTLQGLISTVLAELQAGNGISDTTMAALQAVDASLDSTVSGFAAGVTPAPPAPPAPAPAV